MHRSFLPAPSSTHGRAVTTLILFTIALAVAGCGQHPLGTIRITPASRAPSAIPRALAATVIVPSVTATPFPLTPLTPPPTQPPVAQPPAATPTAEPEPVASPPEPEPETLESPAHAAPTRIAIPRIGVNARVIPVGEAADGTMESPDNPTDVGWWAPGVPPGDIGSAVMGGHVDFAGFGAAVFWNLRVLLPGDEVTVISADNATLVFAVTEVATYSYDDASVIDRIYRSADHQRLNLITCTGAFDPRTHNYDQRIVVYTSLVGS